MDSEESSIERLKRNLYSRNDNLVPKEKRTPVSPHEVDVRQNWGNTSSFEFSPEAMAKKNNSFFNKFLLWSFAFFILSLGIAGFIFYGGLNMISSNNLEINIVVPSSVSSGEELLAGLTIVNANRTDLEETALFIDYPDGAQSVTDDNKILTHEKINLGTIMKGKSATHNIQAVLFGEKDAIKSFTLKLEYRVKGSNAVFSKEKTFDVTIGSSPIIMNVDYPKEINSGQVVTLTINMTSNSSIPVKNTLVKVEYPYGFTYKDSNIAPYRDNSVWNIGDLKDGDKKVITIRGVMVGQNSEDRSFRISSGSESSDRTKDFDTPLATGIFTIGIRKSFFGLSVDSIKNNAVNAGQSVPISIGFQNTLTDKILNVRVEASMSGNAFDRNKVSVGDGGFYKSIDDAVVWDKNLASILAVMSPGDSNQFSMSLTPIDNLISPGLIKNPHIDIHVVLTGDKSGMDASSISSEEDITIKINSTMSIKAKSFRDVGPFKNSGPIPPRADTESTYTITWTLSNSTNDIKNGVVTATLPSGVVWKGEASPSGEKIDFNSGNNQITWSVGNVSYGVGYIYAPREVSFKVGLTPSLNQVGSQVSLLSQTSATAIDTYTNQQISGGGFQVTTRYSDPSFSAGKDLIVK